MIKLKFIIIFLLVVVICILGLTGFLYQDFNSKLSEKQEEISKLIIEKETVTSVIKDINKSDVQIASVPNCSLDQIISNVSTKGENLKIVSVPISSEEGYTWFMHYLESVHFDDNGSTYQVTCKSDFAEQYNKMLEVFSPEYYGNYTPSQDRGPIIGKFEIVNPEQKKVPLFYTIARNKSGQEALVSINFQTKEVRQFYSTKYLSLSLLDFYGDSDGISLLFTAYRTGNVCGEGDCAAKINIITTEICKNAAVGLWEVNVVTGKATKVKSDNCNYIGG